MFPTFSRPRAVFTAAVLLAILSGEGARAAEPATRAAVASGARDGAHQTAVMRKRRIILNNDGDDCLAPGRAGTPAVEQFLQQRTAPLVGSQVDTVFYCSIRCFGSVLHRTEVAENLATHLRGSFPDALLGRLLAEGSDPLQAMVEFCRSRHLEIFCSMRMNDTHDAANPSLRPRLKEKHPEYLLGSAAAKPALGQWTAVDYGQREVRELAVRMIQEVCQRYEVDGVELDFFRHPVLFRSHALHGGVGEAERELLTAMVREMRAVVHSAAAQRGRPILIALRVPDSVEYCRAIGIDLERWLREGLTDLLVVGGYFRLKPWEDSVRLGHQHGVPVYPSLDVPVVVLDPKVPAKEFSLADKLPWVAVSPERPMDARRNSLESWRGRAAVAWQAAADGVYLFNLFTPTHPLLRQIGDPASLAGTDKLYFVNWRGTRQPPSSHLPRSNIMFAERPVNPLFPLEVTDAPLAVTLRIGDETPASTAGGRHPTMSAELWLQPAASIASVAVSCNGRRLERGVVVGDRVTFAIADDVIQPGANVFGLRRSAESGSPKVFLRDLVLHVEYRGNP